MSTPKESGFYYVSSRYYDPQICRWINADDASNLGANSDFASINLFAYCGNNPVDREDSEGDFWHIVGAALLGSAINAGFEILSQIKNGATLNTIDWTSVAIEAGSGALTGLAVSVGLPAGGVSIAKAAIGAGTEIAHGIHENRDSRETLIRAGISAAESLLGDEISNSIAGHIHIGKHEQIGLIKQMKIDIFCDSQNTFVQASKAIVPNGVLKLLVNVG